MMLTVACKFSRLVIVRAAGARHARKGGTNVRGVRASGGGYEREGVRFACTYTYTPAPKHPLRDGLKPRARIIWALAVDVPATRDRATHTTRVSKQAVPPWVVRG